MAARARGELTRQAAVACCKLYISDSRTPKALELIERAAQAHAPGAPLLHVFEDKDYNRVGYTLAGLLPPTHPNPNPDHRLLGSREFPSQQDQKQRGGQGRSSLSSAGGRLSSSSECLPLRAAVADMASAAVANIDLREHSGTHPRIGVVDHISFSALGSASLEDVAALARAVAFDIAEDLGVPTFLYGAAHPEGRLLDAVRRSLGYFHSDTRGKWAGCPDLGGGSSLSPDFGPNRASSKTGVMVIGACPWVMNYNVPLLSTDLAIAKSIARKVSGRGGGLPQVQAMALLHGDDSCEIACNLLDVERTSPESVQEMVGRLATAEGLGVRPGYLTGQGREEVLDLALQRLSSSVNSRDTLSS